MWARKVRIPLAVLRHVHKQRAAGVGVVHRVTGLSSSSGTSVHTGQWASAVPRRRACMLQITRPYGAAAWDEHTPSTEAADWKEENRAEELPEFNIKWLVNLLQQENGKDLCVIRIPPEMKYVEYFVIVCGSSTRHVQALAQYTLKVYKHMKKDSKAHVCLEGKDTDDWMCIDFGNMVVHFMLPETRDAYELEKLWTLRSHDDQLSQMVPETLPPDFMFGIEKKD